MKTIQFVLSILVGICAAGMLYGAITTYSPMKSGTRRMGMSAQSPCKPAGR